MADNYCDQAGTNAVHHHHQECEDPLSSLHLATHGSPQLIHNQKSGPVINKAVTNLRSVSNNDTREHYGAPAFLSSSLA